MKTSLFARWSPKLFVFLTVAAPLVFAFSNHDTFDLPKMALAMAVFLIVAALWIWSRTGESLPYRKSGVELPLLCFLVAAGISSYLSIDPLRSLWGSYRSYVYGWLPMAGLGGLFWFSTQVDDEKFIGRVVSAVIVSGTLASLYGLMQYSGHEIFARMPKVVGGRVWGSLGNPIYFGAICMMTLPLAVTRIRTSTPLSVRLAYAASTIILGCGLLISQSRSSWIGAVIGLMIVAWAGGVGFSRAWKILLAGMAVFVIAGKLFEGVSERAWVLASSQESSNRARLEGWKGGLRIWQQYPFWGSGPDTFFEAFRPHRSEAFTRAAGIEVTQFHAHNELIQIASTMGAVGLAGWCWLIVSFVRRFRQAPGSGEYAAAAASVAAMFVQNQFNPPSAGPATWMAVLAGASLSFGSLEPAARRPWPIAVRTLFVGGILGAGLWVWSLPVRAELHYKDGIVLDAYGKRLNAIWSYRAAAALRPDIEAYQNALGNSARTLAQMSSTDEQRKKYWEEAWRAAEIPTQQHPANPDAWNSLGVAAMWLTQEAGINRMADAKTYFEKAIALDPVFVDAWANLAKWRHFAGDLAGEKEIWKIVLRFHPQHEMALRVLGRKSAVATR